MIVHYSFQLQEFNTTLNLTLWSRTVTIRMLFNPAIQLLAENCPPPRSHNTLWETLLKLGFQVVYPVFNVQEKNISYKPSLDAGLTHLLNYHQKWQNSKVLSDNPTFSSEF